ncbi:MAG: response regulator, partial [Gammaproteobacteria bacterium]|nr:response regulator [Gammaproteobacteria bacterium]
MEARLAAVFDFDDPSPACLQLMQSIKRQCPSVPIVMLTETHSEELAVWAFRARVWNYLVKPVPLRELRANLKQLIDLASHRDGSASRALERPASLVPSREADRGQMIAKVQTLRRVIEGLRPNTGQRISV